MSAEGEFERELEALLERHDPTDEEARKALTAVLRRRRATKKLEERKAQMARWMLKRQRELGEKAMAAFRAGAGPTHEAVLAWRNHPTITEAARAVLPAGTSPTTIKRLVGEFDYFCLASPQEIKRHQAAVATAALKGEDPPVVKRGWGSRWFLDKPSNK